jgi:prepilin-type processing-associated H-X9-DG protein
VQPTTTGNRGLFGLNTAMKVKDVPDGLSTTLAFSECVRPPGSGSGRATNSLDANYNPFDTNPSGCLAAQQSGVWANATQVSDRNRSTGSRWHQGLVSTNAFNTILPPNAGVCNNWGTSGSGVLPPRSKHVGGVNAVFADGAVVFISQNIDYGNLSGSIATAGSASPYGVWGALGTRQGGESVRYSQ